MSEEHDKVPPNQRQGQRYASDNRKDKTTAESKSSRSRETRKKHSRSYESHQKTSMNQAEAQKRTVTKVPHGESRNQRSKRS